MQLSNCRQAAGAAAAATAEEGFGGGDGGQEGGQHWQRAPQIAPQACPGQRPVRTCQAARPGMHSSLYLLQNCCFALGHDVIISHVCTSARVPAYERYSVHSKVHAPWAVILHLCLADQTPCPRVHYPWLLCRCAATMLR